MSPFTLQFAIRISRKFSSSVRHINRGQDACLKRIWKHKKSLTDNLENGTHAITNHIKIPSQFRSITKQISKQTSSKDVARIITESNPLDISVYAMGIRKCNLLNNVCASMEILEIMKQHSIERSAAIYTLLINGLCHQNRLNEAHKLLNAMKADGIEATNEAYTALLGGCKSRKNVQFAEKIWNKMKSKDVIVYTVMISIYSKCAMTEKAEYLWSDLLANGNEAAIDEAICCSMISVYSNHMMPSKAIGIIQFMKQQNIKMNINHYSSLIHCFLRMKNPKNALNIFCELRSNQIDFNHIAFNQLCIANYQLIESELSKNNAINIQKVQKHYNELMKLSVQYKKFLICDEDKKWFGMILFDAMIAMNEQSVIVNKTMLIKQFKLMQNNQYLNGYWTKDASGEWMIDLHFHSKHSARFILRYIFEFERHYLARNELIVICGKSSHSLSIATEETMKACIIKELLSWQPPIRAVVDKNNDGRLVLNLTQV